ncbi:hypothetical protein VPH35_111229 [Triticum aestivum]
MGAFPSPPPWGWSTGFITTPLTTGRLPSQHLDPALPKLFWFTPTLPTCPTVAKQFWDTKRTSPDGNLKVADLPSFAMSFATAHAALANFPPLPRVISMLCMAVPKGISGIERRFPHQKQQKRAQTYNSVFGIVPKPLPWVLYPIHN